MIKLSGVSKIYRANGITTNALKSVDLHIEEGEFCAIVGRSGCGKSTLLNILGFMDTMTSGSYHFDGIDVRSISIRGLPKFRNEKVGFIFQGFNLIPDLTVIENVAMPLGYAGASKMKRSRKAKELLEKVGLTNRINHYAGRLSGGEQQRVAIARALISSPRVVLADEPTGNLDEENCKIVMSLLAEVNKEGTTIVMVSHDELSTRYASRIIPIRDGTIVSCM